MGKHTSRKRKGLELLAPAGSPETFRAVLCAGADAVYLGGSQFGARAYAGNFTEPELLEALDYAHVHNRKVFLTVNTLLKNEEQKERLYEYLLPYYEAGLDAVIVQDYGVFHFIRENFNELPLHASTQMTVAGVEGARFLKEQGAQRIVTARELSLSELRAISDQVDVELESFVHGALCYCYSGQCLLSSMLGGRSGNRGRCAQPCRLPYTVLDEQKKILNRKNPYILSLKDMNTIEFLPKIAENGVYSFKIEGRMKSTSYASGVVSVYRKYMDLYLNEGAEAYRVTEEDKKKLYDFGNRSGFTDGYYHRHNGADMLTGAASAHNKAADKIEQLTGQYLTTEIKEEITGRLTLYRDCPAMLEVSDGTYTAYAAGAVAEQAKSCPMSRENILQKIKKTGNTPFIFTSIEADIQEDIFLPVAELNRLRKEALTQLEQQRLEPYRRHAKGYGHEAERKNSAGDKYGQENRPLIVSTECRAGLTAACRSRDVRIIYLDALLYENGNLTESLRRDIRTCHDAGKQAFYAFPYVFRKKTADFYRGIAEELCALPLDGFVVRSYDALGFVKEELPQGKALHLDSGMYTWSDEAAEAFYRTAEAALDTVPLELNRREIAKRDNGKSALLLYGYLPLMVSAGCVHRNTEGCDKVSRRLLLKDRYQVSFPVRNCCGECFNILYNAKPLVLFQHAKELQGFHTGAWRIHFTWEDEKEAEKALAVYHQAFVEGADIRPEAYFTDYTNGHYKRGVE